MPAAADAVVAAEQVEALVGSYADVARDLACRHGCGPDEALDVLAVAAVRVVDGLVASAPDEPIDGDALLGRWLAAVRAGPAGPGRTWQPAADGRPPVAPGAGPGAVPVTAHGVERTAAAVASLPEELRDAVLLRDRYDLPAGPTATALGVAEGEALRLVARGRMAVFTAVTGRAAPDLTGHAPDPRADLGRLCPLADGSPPGDDTLALRRHVAGCPDCADAVTVQSQARRLVAALPLAPLADDERAALAEEVREAALSVLPATVDLVAFAGEEAAPVAALLVVVLIVLAAVAGMLTGVFVAS